MIHGVPVDGLAWVAALLVGASKGGLPMVGMLAVPLMALHMPAVQATVLLLPIFVISDLAGLWLYRRAFSAPNLRILIPAGLVGVFLGWLTAAQVSDRVVVALIGGMGVVFCLNAWLGRKVVGQPKPARAVPGLAWGMTAGFASFIAHAGGPPFQMYVLPQRLDKAEFAGTATWFFAAINAAKILPYHQLRPYSLEQLSAAAMLVPCALIGAVTGAWLTRRLADRWFFTLVQLSLLLVSVQLLWEALAS
ncbi:MAG: sulfite exporter TauE/SafE family protein [Rhodoferax sp.]